MKRVILLFVFFMFSMISFGSAFEANVTIQDDFGSFSGAFLKIKSVDSDVFIDDKIYPSDFSLVSVGIVKFSLEVSLGEIDLNIKLIKDGVIVDDFEAGPFIIDGSEILIDRRERVEVAEVIGEVVNESVVEEVNESVNEDVVVVEDEDSEDEESSGFLTGMAVLYNEDGSFNWRYSVGGGVVVFLLVVVLLVLVVHRRKSGDVAIADDEKELKYMEKKVKETEGKIAKIKDGKAREEKLAGVRVKLAEEEAELRGLENGGDKKEIKRQEKVVDRAEERVEKVNDQEES